MLTAQQIAAAKKGFAYQMPSDVLHEHDDCIRLAYEWFDAQSTIKGSARKNYPLKHIIQQWAGRYISQHDVEIAAAIHPKILGKYPNFNLSAKLVLPSDSRLSGIGEALTQSNYRNQMDEAVYKSRE